MTETRLLRSKDETNEALTKSMKGPSGDSGRMRERLRRMKEVFTGRQSQGSGCKPRAFVVLDFEDSNSTDTRDSRFEASGGGEPARNGETAAGMLGGCTPDCLFLMQVRYPEGKI
jgi:hypothetical protein